MWFPSNLTRVCRPSASVATGSRRQSSERGDDLAIVLEGRAVGRREMLGNATEPPPHDRRAMREGFDRDDRTGFVPDRGDDKSGHGGEERADPVPIDATGGCHVVESCCQAVDVSALRPVPRDNQLELGGVAKRLDQWQYALDRLEPAEEREPVVGARTTDRSRIGDEVGQHQPILERQPASRMLVQHELRRRDDRVEMPERAGKKIGRPPDLRRSVEVQAAAEAARPPTQLAVVLPEHVHRTDEPVLVQRQEPHAVAEAHHARAEQRDVVEVRHIESLGRKEAPQGALLQARTARQIRDPR